MKKLICTFSMALLLAVLGVNQLAAQIFNGPIPKGGYQAPLSRQELLDGTERLWRATPEGKRAVPQGTRPLEDSTGTFQAPVYLLKGTNQAPDTLVLITPNLVRKFTILSGSISVPTDAKFILKQKAGIPAGKWELYHPSLLLELKAVGEQKFFVPNHHLRLQGIPTIS